MRGIVLVVVLSLLISACGTSIPSESSSVERSTQTAPAFDAANPLIAKGDPLRLSVSFAPCGWNIEMLKVEIFNDGPRPVRVWQGWNSWGHDMLNVDVRAAGSSHHYTITSGPGVWGKNYPSWDEIPVGGSIRKSMDLWVENFSVPKELWTVEGEIEFRVRFSISRTPEAEKNGVFIGTVETSWCRTMSYRRWLPDKKAS
jgi:hypothetical protein